MSGMRRELPKYDVSRGDVYSSVVKPPFDFEGVVMRIFPLRARLERLQAFVDTYLNVAPPEAAYFRPYLPFVHLIFIHYGRLSLDAANLGWLSQYEVIFNIPLLWYKKVHGELVFHDFATASPFIYVDNDHSMTTGREAYGWPKDRFYADDLSTAWMKNPEASPVLARFSVRTLDRRLSGDRPTSPLFEIRRSGESDFARFPFSPTAAWLPWMGWPRAIAGAVGMIDDYLETMRGLGLTQMQPGVGMDNYARMASRFASGLNLYDSNTVFNTINLKQFRDAEDPQKAAYQALTNAPMLWRRVRRAGLLGENRMLEGDPSGGFSIDLYAHPAAPLVDLLGLDVEEATHSGDESRVTTVRPVFPSWVEVDMRYGLGKTLAWRTKKGPWHDEEGEPVLPGVDSSSSRANRPSKRVDPLNEADYNTARGPADTAVAGPFEMPQATVRVMPLLADEAKLTAFLRDKYIGAALKDEGIEVLPWGHYVYLVATSYEVTASRTNKTGWWSDQDIVFYVPAKLVKKGTEGADGKKGDVLWKVALVPVHAYVNSAVAAHTSREVNGLPAVSARLLSPNSEWMGDRGPAVSTPTVLLSVRTAILPSVGLGQKLEERLILEVFTGDPIPAGDQTRWRAVAEGWGQALKEEQIARHRPPRKEEHDDTFTLLAKSFVTAHALSARLLLGKAPISFLTLKQFRDAELPHEACYQAVVEVEREITAVETIEEIETGIYVRIHDYPTHPVARTLGLQPLMQEMTADGILTDVFEAVRPFWMKVSLREPLGRHLLVRAGGAQSSAIREEDEKIELPVSTSTWLFDHPRRLRDRYLERPGDMVNRAETLQQVIEKLQPQTILESILSSEWANWGESRWLAALPKVKEEVQVPPTAEGAVAEFAAFCEMYKRLLPLFDEGRADRWTVRQVMVRRFSQRLLDIFDRETLRCERKGPVVVEFVKHYKGALDKWEDSLRRGLELRQFWVDRELDFCEFLQGSDSKDFTDSQDLSVTSFRASLKELSRYGRNPTAYLQVYPEEDEAFLQLMATAYQKSYLAIRCSMIANADERDRLFPREDCRIDGWFDASSIGIGTRS